MSVAIIRDRLATYDCKSEIEEEQAVREITQELILAALGRTEFFKEAAFQGGTCLRVLYGLDRFSEDLDFALKERNPDFEWEKYLGAVTEELAAYGYRIEIQDRSARDTRDTMIKKALIKDDTIGKVLNFHYAGKAGVLSKIRIRLEVDSNPPSGSEYDIRYLDFPFVSSVVVQTLPSLFAGKIHALLCRDYLKGRDWYDFLWYTARKTPINYTLLSSALAQVGPWKGAGLSVDYSWCFEALRNKIETNDWQAAAEDVRRFVRVRDQKSLHLWSRELFLQQLAKIPRE
jgi:predicted nucleotidyltransferase component of viral defense system